MYSLYVFVVNPIKVPLVRLFNWVKNYELVCMVCVHTDLHFYPVNLTVYCVLSICSLSVLWAALIVYLIGADTLGCQAAKIPVNSVNSKQ